MQKSESFVSGNAFLNKYPSIVQVDDKYFVLDNDGTLHLLSPELDLMKIREQKEYANHHWSKLDVDNNDVEEHILTSPEFGTVTICEDNFKHPVSFNIRGSRILWISPIISKQEANQYLVRTNTGHYYVTYRKNRLWSFRYIYYAGAFVVLYLLLLIIGKVQQMKIKEKLRIEQEIKQLQYSVITSRFTPHYTFNVLNNISSHVYTKENPELYNYFSKFIRQLRYLYDDHNAYTRTLKEEIDFCRDYLDIQKMRFPDKFEYQINLNGQNDYPVQVPKMLLHTFVENAFKHGIRPYDSGGLISIDIETDQQFHVTITDNGIGRKAAKDYVNNNPQFSSGKGLKMMKELISLMEQGNKESIRIDTNDLMNHGKSIGTEVKITITNH